MSAPTETVLAPRVGKVLRAPKTAELIAGHLRRQIVRGELKAGKTLPPEVQLMEQYGVSRPTLREAFRILEAETLISVRRGARGGAQVISPDISVAARYVGLLLQMQGTTVEDVYEARMVTEPYCARLLAKRRTERDLRDLQACVEQLRGTVRTGPQAAVPDASQWSDVTYRFHELVTERCGNKTLGIQAAVLQDIVATHLRLTIAQGFTEDEAPARFQVTIRSYAKLVRLIEAHSADAAEAHWRRHMENAGKYLFRNGQRNRPVIDLFV